MTSQPQRVALFGATGKIGRHVLDQLLTNGHDVAAYVRNPAKLDLTHPKLTVIQGQLGDAAVVASAISGADAVISALGPTLNRKATGTPIGDGTRNIVAGMYAAGVRRYIGLATPTMAEPRDRPTFKGKLLRLMPRMVMPNALVEIDSMASAVTASRLDWTIARITNPPTSPRRAPPGPARSMPAACQLRRSRPDGGSTPS
jgi:putative NADH-flavin reductase